MNRYLLISIFLFCQPKLFAQEIILPAIFENNQIYLIPTLTDNRQIRFFTDTGGGWNVISKSLHDNYKLKSIIKKTKDSEIKLSEMPLFAQDKSIPLGGLDNFMEGYLFIAEKERFSLSGNEDGFLGGRWHAEKIIGFDYLNQKMSIYSLISGANVEKYDTLKLGFQKSDGQYTTAFPSVEIKILGLTLPMLFDTGATAKLSEKAKDILANESELVGTSYIVSSIFDKWRAENPTWLVIDGADTLLGEAMIKVPQVQIGSLTIGPVWFTRRPDSAFHEFMSSMMDRKVDGAIGGSLLKYLSLIVDYPNETLYVSDKNG